MKNIRYLYTLLVLIAGALSFLISKDLRNILLIAILFFPYLIFSLVSLVIFALALLRKKVKLWMVSLLMTSVCIFIGFITGTSYSRQRIARYAENEGKKDEAIVREIATAIKKFKEDKNEFPKSISELVPSYLNNLPHTSQGKEFQYTFSSSNVIYFSICYEDIEFGKCYNSSSDKVLKNDIL